MPRHLCKQVKLMLFILLNLMMIFNGMAQNQKRIEGNWQGTFQLRFVFKISADAAGNLTATFDSPDQASVNVPVSKITFVNDTLYIAMDFAGLTFVGTMNYDHEVIQGQLSQYGLTYSMELKRLEQLLPYMAPRLTESGERELDYTYRVPEQFDDGWETADMSAAGIDEHKINELMHDVLNEQYQNVHSILVVKNEKLVIEEYFYGFHRHKKHGIHSVTKSILSALFGIAMDRQLITDLDEKIQGYFPEYADVLNQGAKSQITLRHLLTMTAGFEYDEDSYSFFDDRNSHVAMDKSGNPIRYIFESPLQNQPGEKFNYNSGLSITLGEIIKRASSLPADKFAEKYLFAPLGISDYYWAI